MWRQEYHFDLPPELIARRPPAIRGESRLMVLPRVGPPETGSFARLVDAFRGDEVLVLNDTRVVPARLRGQKATGGAAEALVVEAIAGGLEPGGLPIGTPPAWRPTGSPVPGACPPPGDGVSIIALLRGKRLGPGTRLTLGGQEALVEAVRGEGAFEVRFPGLPDLDAFWTWLDAAGEMPLPPYLERPADADDRTRYQTVFAREPGAVAAPTAGLHFTDALLDALRARGVAVTTLTLHVGLGTFLPVRTDDLDTHRMHTERFEVPAEARALLGSGRPVVAVGTTVVRALETYARAPEARITEIFIRPGFDFRIVDGLLTNFHLPESTLLMLVSALVGRERLLAAYAHAVEARMRFFSYGDAMLLRRPGGRWT